MSTPPDADPVAEARQLLASAPDLDGLADFFNFAGNSERLKILYLIENMSELSVVSASQVLADTLGVSVPAVELRIEELRAQGLLAVRRDLQTLYYRHPDHPFDSVLRDAFARLRG